MRPFFSETAPPNVASRHAHFSREREMVLRDISREKCGREKLREKSTNFGLFRAQFDQELNNLQGKRYLLQKLVLLAIYVLFLVTNILYFFDQQS